MITQYFSIQIKILFPQIKLIEQQIITMPRPESQLTAQEVTQLQKLQQLFHKQYLNAEFLHQLVAIYVKAIECFGEEWKFMRAYFMDKMQFVLSCPEIVKMLEGGGTMVESIRETVRITERVMPGEMGGNFLEQPKQNVKPREKSPQQDRFAPHPQQPTLIKHTEQHHYYHYNEQKNPQKGMKIDHKMKVMRQVEQNLKNIHHEVNEADKKLVIVEEKVKGITKGQEEKFNERLAQRKKKLRKKSVEIKAKVAVVDGHQPEPEPPVIKKEELKEAQRELTRAVFNFTVRMTEKQREKQSNELKKSVKGRVKKAKDIDQDQILLQQQQQEQPEPTPIANIKMRKKSTRQNEELKKQLALQKQQEQQQQQQQGGGRIKTVRRRLDSEEEEGDSEIF